MPAQDLGVLEFLGKMSWEILLSAEQLGCFMIKWFCESKRYYVVATQTYAILRNATKVWFCLFFFLMDRQSLSNGSAWSHKHNSSFANTCLTGTSDFKNNVDRVKKIYILFIYFLFKLLLLPCGSRFDDNKACVFWRASLISCWNYVPFVAALFISFFDAGRRKILPLLPTRECQQEKIKILFASVFCGR